MSKKVALAAAVAALLPVAQAQATQGVTLDQYGRLLIGGQDVSQLVASDVRESGQQARPGAMNVGCDIPLAARPGAMNVGCDIPLAARPGAMNVGCDIPLAARPGAMNVGCDIPA